MEQPAWSIETTGIVNASPERVMSWWFHPDRKNDFRERIEKTGAVDFSLVESSADGIRVRTTTWKDRRRWVHLHQSELVLDPNGMAPRSGGRFIASGSETVVFQHPQGKKFGFSCTARIEFVPQASGSTQIVVNHRHTTAEGMWLQRRLIRRFERTRQSDEEQIARCQAAMSR